jgi:hypothetical protein
MRFTEGRIAFRDTLKRFISKEVATIANEVDRNDRFPAGILKTAEGWHAVPGIEPDQLGPEVAELISKARPNADVEGGPDTVS